MPKETSVFTAELIAAVQALLLHDPRLPLEIYSDNEAVVNLLRHEQKTNLSPKHEMAAEWLHAARQVLRLRHALQVSTKFIHVYSHLLDTEERRLTPEQKTRLERMKEKLGALWRHILLGNRAVDRAAKQAAALPYPRAIFEFPRMPRFLSARYGTPKQELANPINAVKHIRAQEHVDTLRKHATKYKWLDKRNVDWHRSAYLGRNTSRSADALQRHASKSRRQLFATKDSWLDHQEREDHFMLSRYKGIIVTNDTCDSCRHIEAVAKVESKHHYLTCAAHEERRKEMTEEIRSRIQDDLRDPPTRIPCFWNESEKHPDLPPDANEWHEIENSFTAEDAACGIIPRAWVTYLQKLPRQQESNLEKLIADCQRILVQGFFECWKARCKKFYQLHRRDGTYLAQASAVT